MGDDAAGANAASGDAGLAPAGWYPDPSREAELRWWSGDGWSTETQRRTVPAEPPPAVPARPAPAPEPEPEPEPARTSREWRRIAASRRGQHHESPNTAAVWVLAFIPILTLAWSFASIAANQRASLEIAIALQLIGLALYLGLVVWDRIGLARVRLLAPSLWWQLLPIPLVYLIVRRVTLRRQGVISNWPGNVFALVFVAAAALSVTTFVPVATGWANTLQIRVFEEDLTAQLEDSGQGPATVDCPSDARLDRPGDQFDCLIIGPRSTIRITMEVLPDRHLTFVEVVRVGEDPSEG